MPMPWVGLLARGVEACEGARFIAPSAFPDGSVEWTSEERSPLTVAGPRRCYTGLPCYALAGTQDTYSVVAMYVARRQGGCQAARKSSLHVSQVRDTARHRAIV